MGSSKDLFILLLIWALMCVGVTSCQPSNTQPTAQRSKGDGLGNLFLVFG